MNLLETLSDDDLLDIRKSLNIQCKATQEFIKQIERFYEEFYDIVRQNELKRERYNSVMVGVYSARKKDSKIERFYYHIVSEDEYEFNYEINGCWKLVNVFTLETIRSLKINRIVADLDYWISKNCYSIN